MLGDLLNEKVYWTKKMDLKLVKFLEVRRYVWDPRDMRYSSSRLKDKAYTEFANKTNYDLDARAVKERWNNIRSTFSHNVRKVERSEKTEDNLENVFVPCWHLWEPCQFLFEAKGYVKGDNTDSLMIKTEPTSEDELLSLKLLGDKLNKSDDDEDDDKPLKPSRQSAPTLDCKSIVNGLVAALNQVKNGSVEGDCRNAYDSVGRTVTEKLSTLDSWAAAQATFEIMEVLVVYNEFNPDNPNNKKNTAIELNNIE